MLKIEKTNYEEQIETLSFQNKVMEGDLAHVTTEKFDLTATFKEYRDFTAKKLDERELALNTFKAELRSTQDKLYKMRDELERTQGQMQRSMKET